VFLPGSGESKRKPRIQPAGIRDDSMGSPWLRELYELFNPVREAAAAHSEAEINADIDQAVAEVRDAEAKRRTRISGCR
jgi:hypothetical protein